MQDIPEIRVAVVGNVDAGKSTVLGVLTKGILDDGRGGARSHVFRHKHEQDSGRTSSIGQELLGFGADGRPVYPTASGQRLGWEQVCAQAHRLLSFIDLAGHERYLKTTMFGLTGCSPDYSMLMVGGNAGLVGMAREHLTLCFALGVPVLVVVTKTDMCPGPVLEETMRQLFKVLRSPACKRVPVLVKGAEEALQASRQLRLSRLCPVFQVSNVTGSGLDLLRLFLSILPLSPGLAASPRAALEGPAEFEIVETFAVPGVGTVVSGNMVSGRLGMGQQIYLGPDSLGAWIPTQVKGIHRKRMPVSEAAAGQSVSFALKRVKRSQVHKGMVLLAMDPAPSGSSAQVSGLQSNQASSASSQTSSSRNSSLPSPTLPDRKACREFEAEVIILFHSTTMGPKYQAMVHSGVVRQTACIVGMEQDLLRTGDRAKVRFRFMRHPEYLRVGARMVFREGRTKGIGKITALFD